MMPKAPRLYRGIGETAVMALIQAMLIHSMIIVSDLLEATGHYGAVAIGAPDKKAQDTCRKLGKRVGELVKKLWRHCKNQILGQFVTQFSFRKRR